MWESRYTDSVREPPVNSRLRYRALGMISSEKRLGNAILKDKKSFESYFLCRVVVSMICVGGVTGRHGNVWFNLGMMKFSNSQVGSGETPREYRSKVLLASGHCLDPVLYRRFLDQYRRLAALSPVHPRSSQSSVSHQRVISGSRISPVTRQSFADAASDFTFIASHFTLQLALVI
ncbi:hypothetical protein HAX54_040829 [Datura stramonium]|uniref:Uncharacterized protein n=1 Tax=Datura stramonium TaxID=4076 RepID=A0ABS8VPI2_DATST|nr:hypothetical protein [Datura stramonium]